MKKLIEPPSLIKNTVAYNSCEDVADICQKLFETTIIDYFDYAVTYEDNSFLGLMNNREWYSHCFNRQYSISATLVKKAGVYPWNAYHGNDLVTEIQELFEIRQGITLFKVFDKCIEFYDFGTKISSDKGMVFFMNNLALLEKFICYFKDKASHIIQQAELERIKLPNNMVGQPVDLSHYLQNNSLVKQFSAYKQQVYINGKKYALTQRETEVFSYLSKGFNTRRIAKLLNISPRTVEAHLNNIKTKANVRTNQQLLDSILI